MIKLNKTHQKLTLSILFLVALISNKSEAQTTIIPNVSDSTCHYYRSALFIDCN